MTQFVPLKLDTGSDEFRDWNRTYQTKGNGIPVLYVIRADGEMLYGESGALTGDNLPLMLAKTLQHSGKILGNKDAMVAEAAYQKFYELQSDGDTTSAIKALSKIKKLGVPGEIKSYAEPVVKINEAVRELADEARNKMSEQLKDIQGDDQAKVIDGLLDSYQLKRELSTVRLLKVEFTKFSREVSKLKAIKELVKEVKTIDSARSAKSKTSIGRGIEKLEALVVATANEAVKDRAEKELEALKQQLAGE